MPTAHQKLGQSDLLCGSKSPAEKGEWIGISRWASMPMRCLFVCYTCDKTKCLWQKLCWAVYVHEEFSVAGHGRVTDQQVTGQFLMGHVGRARHKWPTVSSGLPVATPVIFIWDYSPGAPLGSRAKSRLGVWGRKVKQFADNFCTFWLQKRSEFENFAQLSSLFLTSMFHAKRHFDDYSP